MIVRKLILLLPCVCLCCALYSQELGYDWSGHRIDGSRTGVCAPGDSPDSVSLGTVKCGRYYAPNGRVFKGGSVCRAARSVLKAQDGMADVREIVGYSTHAMVLRQPESELSNFAVDALMWGVEKAFGTRPDVGVLNYGGIRVSMPEGNILKDDLLSMFPFKNRIALVTLKGRDLRSLLEDMAADVLQPLGGVRIVVKHGKLVSALVDGREIEDEREYGVATISFLLDGGDNIHVARNAVSVRLSDEDIFDVVLDYVRNETACGRPIESKVDGRVVYER